MKIPYLIALAAALPSIDAIQLAKREDGPARVLQADIQRREVLDPVDRDQRRRRKRQNSGTLQQNLDNLATLYFANASLGTPAQNLRLHIDTGSSDLWANFKNSDLCKSRGSPCGDSGTYDANSSSTYQYVNSVFNISYVDGSGASGDYARDTFKFGGQDIKGLQFGVGYKSTSSEGILGIGYAINEVQVNRAGGNPYPNLPQLLVNSGVIQNNAYSLWLNDLDVSTGSILFGGVDTAKYQGKLQTLPIISERGFFAEFIIALTAMGANGNQGSIFNNQTVPVLLDSGSSLMYLPDEVVSAIYQNYNAQYNARQGAAFVDCNLANSQDTLDFTFSSPTISVPMNELVIEAGTTRSGQTICILGISPSGGSTSVLGDTFLRSAYVVYDLHNNEISLAQTNFNATDSSIQEITNSTGVPDATGVANAVSSVAVTGGAARNGGVASATGSQGAAMPTAMPNSWGVAAAAGLGFLAIL